MQLVEQQVFEYKVSKTGLRPGVLAVVEGVGQRSDEENANGRVYSRNLWEKILPDVQERIRDREMVGELDHPSGESSAKLISHVMTEATLLSSGEVKVCYEIVDTPQGRILDALHRAGVKIGISSRGEGELVERDGKQYVDEETYQLETWDVVINPSTRGAYPAVIAQREARETNNKALLAVLESACNPQVPRPVLTRLQRIVESIETEKHRDQKHQLLTHLQESLGSSTTESPVSSANEVTKMETKQIDPASLGVVQEAVASQTRKVVKQAKSAISEKNQQIAEMQKRVVAAERRVKAAEKVVGTFQSRYRKVKAQNESFKNLQVKFNKLARRHEAACQIIDEMAPKLKEQGVLRKRHNAALFIIEGFYGINKRAQLSAYVESQLAGHPSSKQIARMARKAKSVKEAKEIIENAKKLVEAAPKRGTLTRRNMLPTDPRRQAALREAILKGQRFDPVSRSADPVQRTIDKIAESCGG